MSGDPFTVVLGSGRGGNPDDELSAAAPSPAARERLARLLDRARQDNWVEVRQALPNLPRAAPLAAELLAGLADLVLDGWLADAEHQGNARFIVTGTGAYCRQAPHVLIDAGPHGNANEGLLHLHQLGAWQWGPLRSAVCGIQGLMGLPAVRGDWRNEPERRCPVCTAFAANFADTADEDPFTIPKNRPLPEPLMPRFRTLACRRLALPLWVALARPAFPAHGALDYMLEVGERALYDALADVCVELLVADDNWAVHYIIRQENEYLLKVLQAILRTDGDPDCSGLLDADDWAVLVGQFIADFRGEWKPVPSWNSTNVGISHGQRTAELLEDAARRLIGERHLHFGEGMMLPHRQTPPRGLHGRAREAAAARGKVRSA